MQFHFLAWLRSQRWRQAQKWLRGGRQTGQSRPSQQGEGMKSVSPSQSRMRYSADPPGLRENPPAGTDSVPKQTRLEVTTYADFIIKCQSTSRAEDMGAASWSPEQTALCPAMWKPRIHLHIYKSSSLVGMVGDLQQIMSLDNEQYLRCCLDYCLKINSESVLGLE